MGEGGGLMQDAGKYVSKTAKSTVSSVKKTASNVKRNVDSAVHTVADVSKKLVYGTTELPPKVITMLRNYGAAVISSAVIVRVPLNGLLAGTLNVASLGSFGKELEKKDYDVNYHLRLDLTTSMGSITVEKGAVVTVSTNQQVPKDGETMIVPSVPTGLTLQQLMDNTEQYMGTSKFLGYSSKDNNCQDFVMGILNANHMNTPATQDFTKQDVASLFTNDFRKVSNSVTGIGAKAELIMQGGSVGRKFFSHMGGITSIEPFDDDMTTMIPKTCVHHHYHHMMPSEGRGVPLEKQTFSLEDAFKAGKRLKKTLTGSGIPLERQKFSLEDAYNGGKRLKKTMFGRGVDNGDDDCDDDSQCGSSRGRGITHLQKGSQAAKDHMAKLRAMRGKK